MTESHQRPDLKTLALGTSMGVAAGIALSMATAALFGSFDSEASGPLLVLSFSVGQGGVTALVIR